MACYHPLQAFQAADGSVVFAERGDIVRSLLLPCGQCVGCRLERSRQWAMRCMHEASLYRENCFITLTYDDAHVPKHGSLDYGDFQRFMKRLRKRCAPVRPRFYMCGEYGEDFGRPHFHAVVFGWNFPDRKVWRKGGSGFKAFRSDMLESLWPFGFSSIGEVTFESAAYVARYCMKKVTGDGAGLHYLTDHVDPDTGEVFSKVPEFNHMSLKPGIGAGWLEKWESDVYPQDYVIVRGKKMKPPKYYDRRYSERAPLDFEAVQFARELEARSYAADRTDERLAVREIVTEARLRAFKRSI